MYTQIIQKSLDKNIKKSIIVIRRSKHMEKLFDTKEAAEMLRVSPFTIRSWRFKGILPACKLGKGIRSKVLFRQCDLEKFVEDSFQPAREEI